MIAKVVCVKDTSSPPVTWEPYKLPQLGATYTVRDIVPFIFCDRLEPIACVTLEEIVNEAHQWQRNGTRKQEVPFPIYWFRPLTGFEMLEQARIDASKNYDRVKETIK